MKASVGILVMAAWAASAAAAGLEDPVADGEARVRYLGHAGWLVTTSEHALVFDYTGKIAGGELSDGVLTPSALSGRKVLLFVSHAHGDHFKPRVLKLRETVEDLTVVLGWEDPEAGAALVPADGVWTEIGGARVFALHHDFDGIPEGFFLVRSGGLTLYHSGDHGTWSDPPSAAFTKNVGRLASASKRIDIAFVSSFGMRATRRGLNAGDVNFIRKLEPRVTFPMHCGGCEEHYATFAREAAELELPTVVAVAEAPGDAFEYVDGKVVPFTGASKGGLGPQPQKVESR